MSLLNLDIDTSWTLFLDRDGVINRRLKGDYVKSAEEFEFLPGALEALVRFSRVFGRIVVVTNQQGIGKGVMTEEDLAAIHRYLLDQVHQSGSRIDAIYYAPQLATDDDSFRKPGTGMAFRARKDFPEIDFRKSIMVGDSADDMEFGRNAGMVTVLTGNPEPWHVSMPDLSFRSLKDFSDHL